MKIITVSNVRKATTVILVLWLAYIWGVNLEVMRQFLPRSATTSFSSSTTNNDYSLAFEQSFGFFTDITNEHWMMLQNYHAAMFPNYYNTLHTYSHGPNHKGQIQHLKNSPKWYGQNFQVEFICPLARRLPSDSEADGPKWVCDPHRLAKKKSCLVYSVGSAGKVEFEKAVKEEIGDHCEIHSM